MLFTEIMEEVDDGKKEREWEDNMFVLLTILQEILSMKLKVMLLRSLRMKKKVLVQSNKMS